MFWKHKFKKSLEETKDTLNQEYVKMKSFSDRINKIIGFSQDDFSSADSNDNIFETTKYLFEPRHVCFPDGWKYVFMVCPKIVGGKIGWSNIAHNEFPDGWFYHPKGTATICYPEDEEIVNDIIQELKQ